MEFDPQPFNVLMGLAWWLNVVVSALLFISILGIVGSIIYCRSFKNGIAAFFKQVKEGFIEFISLSPKRILALVKLTVKEAIRRRALMVFAVFAILFMFAGWFLPGTDSARVDMQVKNYVSFVLTAITWLILPVMLLLSCWSLPTDIKNRTLHTIVTKPARRSEIVIGRVLGFVTIGTAVLLLMGTVGYVWIVRQIGDNRDQLVCRDVEYGGLTFLDNEGRAQNAGINVGDEWEYRSFIPGATKAAAIYTFDDVTSAMQGDELVFQSTFEAFRSHKGTITEQVHYQFTFVNEEKGLRIPHDTVEMKEFGSYEDNIVHIPRSLEYYDEAAREQKSVDIINDVAQDGTLTVQVRCVDPGQYMGMARPDFFIRKSNKPFLAGFTKTLLGTWLIMVLIITIGVTLSAIVKGPVATLSTFTLILVGLLFRDFLSDIAQGTMHSAGPFESTVRLFTHNNLTSAMKLGDTFERVIANVDHVIINAELFVFRIVPNFTHYSRLTQYLPNGFDVSTSKALLPTAAVTFGYVFPCLVAGYYFLKLRELESK